MKWYKTIALVAVFFPLLFLSPHSTAAGAKPATYEQVEEDSVTNLVFDLPPELKEQAYAQKRSLFMKTLAPYLGKQHREDVLRIQDTVFINFTVNGKGLVDSVWLVSPKSFPFENTYRFIKNYDFKGPLVEFYTERPRRYACTVKLMLSLNKERNILYTFFDYTQAKEECDPKDMDLSGQIFKQKVQNFSVIPIALLENLNKMGTDNSSILNEWEGKYLNCIFNIDPESFNLVGKKVGFTTSKTEYFKEVQERFRLNSTAVWDIHLYICDTIRKEQSGGYDAIILDRSKSFISIEDIIKRLNE